MPYPRSQIVTWIPDAYYHIYNRGVSKSTLFRSEFNYQYVLRKAELYCREFDLSMIAYCLMPNHYHFVTRQNGDHPAGLLPQRIFNGYTKAYNLRYAHSGTLFERRYQVKLVDSYAYLLHLCRYVHANPVMAGFVDDPGGWPYSNYLDWIEGRNGKLVDPTFVREHFESAAVYKTFVQDYIRTGLMPERIALTADPILNTFKQTSAPFGTIQSPPFTDL